MIEQKTVRVRIAVAVDADGRYRAEGWGGAVDWVAEERVRDSLRHFGAGISVHWFEHDVPLPLGPQTISGTVSDAD